MKMSKNPSPSYRDDEIKTSSWQRSEAKVARQEVVEIRSEAIEIISEDLASSSMIVIVPVVFDRDVKRRDI
jgi:hypothetical protein